MGFGMFCKNAGGPLASQVMLMLNTALIVWFQILKECFNVHLILFFSRLLVLSSQIGSKHWLTPWKYSFPLLNICSVFGIFPRIFLPTVASIFLHRRTKRGFEVMWVVMLRICLLMPLWLIGFLWCTLAQYLTLQKHTALSLFAGILGNQRTQLPTSKKRFYHWSRNSSRLGLHLFYTWVMEQLLEPNLRTQWSSVLWKPPIWISTMLSNDFTVQLKVKSINTNPRSPRKVTRRMDSCRKHGG